MEVLIVNGHRHLINTEVEEHVKDFECERILKQYPEDAIVDWDENVTKEDVMPLSLSDIMKNINN